MYFFYSAVNFVLFSAFSELRASLLLVISYGHKMINQSYRSIDARTNVMINFFFYRIHIARHHHLPKSIMLGVKFSYIDSTVFYDKSLKM